MRFKFWSLQFNQWFVINQLFIILTAGQSSFSQESYFNRFLSDHPYFPSGHYPDHLDSPWATSVHHGYYGPKYSNSNPYGPQIPNGQATPNGQHEGELDQSPVNGQSPLLPGQPPLPPGQPPPLPPGQPQAIARCDCKAEVSAAEKRMRREMSEQEGSDDESSSSSSEEEQSMQESRSAKLAKSRSIESSQGSLEFICQRLHDQKNGQKLSDQRLFDQRVTTSGQGKISKQIVQEKSSRLQHVDSRYRNVLPPPTTTTSPSNQPGQEEVNNDDDDDDDDYQQERDVDRRTTDQEQIELDQEQLQQLKRPRLQSKTNSQNQRSSKLVVFATPTKVQKIDLTRQEREEEIDRLFDRTFGRQGTKRSGKKRKRERKEKRKNLKKRRKNLDEFALKG